MDADDLSGLCYWRLLASEKAVALLKALDISQQKFSTVAYQVRKLGHEVLRDIAYQRKALDSPEVCVPNAVRVLLEVSTEPQALGS